MQPLRSIPYLSNLEPRIFCCTFYAHIPKALRTKLDPCDDVTLLAVQIFRKDIGAMILKLKNYM